MLAPPVADPPSPPGCPPAAASAAVDQVLFNGVPVFHRATSERTRSNLTRIRGNSSRDRPIATIIVPRPASPRKTRESRRLRVAVCQLVALESVGYAYSIDRSTDRLCNRRRTDPPAERSVAHRFGVKTNRSRSSSSLTRKTFGIQPAALALKLIVR